MIHTGDLESHLQEAQLRWAASHSAGGWFRTVLSTLRMLHSAEFISQLRLSPALPSGPIDDEATWANHEQQLLEEAWEVLLQLAAARTLGHCGS